MLKLQYWKEQEAETLSTTIFQIKIFSYFCSNFFLHFGSLTNLRKLCCERLSPESEFCLCQNIGWKIISHMGDSPKWVKSRRRRKKKKEERKLVKTMAKLRMAHASTHGARKPPGPKYKLVIFRPDFHQLSLFLSFFLSLFFFLRLLLLTHFGESPMCEIIFHPIFWHN